MFPHPVSPRTPTPPPSPPSTSCSATVSKLSTKEVFYNQLETWVKETPRGSREDREQAAKRIKAAYDRGSSELSLENYRLSTLPDLSALDQLKEFSCCLNQLTNLSNALPPNLEKLNIGCNNLESLPNHLPEHLQELKAHGNRLTNLTQTILPKKLKVLNLSNNRDLIYLPNILPKTLETLSVEHGRLTILPGISLTNLKKLNIIYNDIENLPTPLPEYLQELRVTGNRLISLPDPLPLNIQIIAASDNHLTHLPPNITSLPQNCEIFIEDNLFPINVLDNLRDIVNAPGYHGPRFHVSMGAQTNTPVRPLEDSVTSWYTTGQKAIKNRWQTFTDEAGSTAFSKYLDRLSKTLYFNPNLKTAVTEWLTHLSTHADLRAQTFAISVEALETCDDRILLSFNEMQKVCWLSKIEDGSYDEKLAELIDLVRKAFRLDELAKIAEEKANSLHFVDKVEVYLGYQVKLNEQLQLGLDTTGMIFFGISRITKDDLKMAALRVKEQEQINFPSYFSQYPPCQSLLKRLDPDSYEAFDRDKRNFIDSDDYKKKLEEELQTLDLGAASKAVYDDAERQIGKTITDKKIAEMDLAYINKFLQSRGIPPLN